MNFKSYLEQSLVKVVLNGGHKELDDATIPFTLAMHEVIAEKQPTHVLVIDIPFDLYAKSSLNEDRNDPLRTVKRDMKYIGERKIYELSKIDFLQFHKPGKHNLIFVLFSDIDKEQKKAILQKRSLRVQYENDINIQDIEEGYLGQNMVGYCEELIEIPEQFFAIVPKSGFKKGWWKWINRWFDTDPIDECEFRKRAIVALTIQPVVWFIGFLLRLTYGTIISVFAVVIKYVLYLSGQQTIYIFKNIGAIYVKFIFSYPNIKTAKITSFGFWEDAEQPTYKYYSIGKKEIKIPFSPFGLAIQIFLWSIYFGSIRYFWYSSFSAKRNLIDIGPLMLLIYATLAAFFIIGHLSLVLTTLPYERAEEWVTEKFGERRSEVSRKQSYGVYFLCAIIMTCFFVAQIPWSKIGSAIIDMSFSLWSKLIFAAIAILVIVFRKKFWKNLNIGISYLNRFIDRLNKSLLGKWLTRIMPVRKIVVQHSYGGTVTSDVVQKKKPRKLTRTEWLKVNMNINQLPDKVDLQNIIAETKANQVIQRFKVSFWRAKSKVCKPYAK